MPAERLQTGREIGSIAKLNGLPAAVREGLYTRLVPSEVLARVAVDRRTGMNAAGDRLVRVVASPGQPWARVEVRAAWDDRDPLLLVDVETSPFGVPELSFVQITDPTSPRFDIDRDAAGRDTLFGTETRNRPEEARALAAGLAPGQVRHGLRLLGHVMTAMEDFCRLLGTELFLIEPLFYHSALLYERHGCAYLFGRELMEEIDTEFRPGGRLQAALDGSSVFRQPGMAETIRGRSWAIHDGILSALNGASWGGVKMYRQAGRPADISTFPGARY
ncbi:MAG TPA: hypothetical protein VGW35_14685 [Methylomirabilota bacterium]|jgi:hypothetical protein|nr:hypothetical protein [Methylomirabilota bacterium]